MVEDAFGDRFNLIHCFAGPVDDLRDALPQAAVVVDVCETQVLVWHEAKLGESFFRRRAASGDAIEQLGQLFAVQDVGSSCFRVRVISSITASPGEMRPCSRALTFSAMGISTRWRAASSTAQLAVATPSATIRMSDKMAGSFLPRPSCTPTWVIAAALTCAGQDQIAKSGETCERLGPGSHGDTQLRHLGQAAGDKGRAGIGAKFQAVADTGRKRHDVLEGAAELHADGIRTGVDPKGWGAEHLLYRRGRTGGPSLPPRQR